MSEFSRYFKILIAVTGIIFALAVLTACTSNTTTSQPGGTTPTSTVSEPDITINISASNLAFDKNKIEVVAGSDVLIVFENKDQVRHNVAIYTNSSALTPIFVGEIFPGPATKSYRFTAPIHPGAFFFRCDVHPDTMTGDFIVYGTAS